MLKKSIYTPICAMVCFYLYSGAASAQCIQNQKFRDIQVNIPSVTYTLQYNDTSVGDLGSFDVPYLSAPTITTSQRSTCGYSYINGRFVNYWEPNNGIAPSNIPGIGFSIESSDLDGPFNTRRGPRSPIESAWTIYDTAWHIKIKKTGQVNTSGSIRSGFIAQVTQSNSGISEIWNLTLLNIPTNAIQIRVVNCSLKSAASTINLGDWYDTQFPAIGSASTTADIPITLSCLAGTNIKATVTATSGTENAEQGLLALSGNDKATGIAIQLLDQNTIPIPLGSEITVKNNTANGNYIFGWKARYIKIADKVTPGSANGTATINIRYE